MKLDRFGFKALSKRGGWLIAELETDGENYGVRWHCEGSDFHFTPSWIEESTLCQSTGLRDSKGNLIYENDIIQRTDGSVVTARYLVEYNPNSLHFQIHNCGERKGDYSDLSFLPMWMEHGVKIEVIGNALTKEMDK